MRHPRDGTTNSGGEAQETPRAGLGTSSLLPQAPRSADSTPTHMISVHQTAPGAARKIATRGGGPDDTDSSGGERSRPATPAEPPLRARTTRSMAAARVKLEDAEEEPSPAPPGSSSAAASATRAAIDPSLFLADSSVTSTPTAGPAARARAASGPVVPLQLPSHLHYARAPTQASPGQQPRRGSGFNVSPTRATIQLRIPVATTAASPGGAAAAGAAVATNPSPTKIRLQIPMASGTGGLHVVPSTSSPRPVVFPRHEVLPDPRNPYYQRQQQQQQQAEPAAQVPDAPWPRLTQFTPVNSAPVSRTGSPLLRAAAAATEPAPAIAPASRSKPAPASQSTSASPSSSTPIKTERGAPLVSSQSRMSSVHSTPDQKMPSPAPLKAAVVRGRSHTIPHNGSAAATAAAASAGPPSAAHSRQTRAPPANLNPPANVSSDSGPASGTPSSPLKRTSLKTRNKKQPGIKPSSCNNSGAAASAAHKPLQGTATRSRVRGPVALSQQSSGRSQIVNSAAAAAVATAAAAAAVAAAMGVPGISTQKHVRDTGKQRAEAPVKKEQDRNLHQVEQRRFSSSAMGRGAARGEPHVRHQLHNQQRAVGAIASNGFANNTLAAATAAASHTGSLWGRNGIVGDSLPSGSGGRKRNAVPGDAAGYLSRKIPEPLSEPQAKRQKKEARKSHGLSNPTRYVTGSDGKRYDSLASGAEPVRIKPKMATEDDKIVKGFAITPLAPGEPLHPEVVRVKVDNGNRLFKASSVRRQREEPKTLRDEGMFFEMHKRSLKLADQMADRKYHSESSDEEEEPAPRRRFRHLSKFPLSMAHSFTNKRRRGFPVVSKEAFYKLPQNYHLHVPLADQYRGHRSNDANTLMPMSQFHSDTAYPTHGSGARTRRFAHTLPDNSTTAQNLYLFRHGGHHNHMYNAMYRAPGGGRSLNGRWKTVSRRLLSKRKMERLRALQQKKRQDQKAAEDARLERHTSARSREEAEQQNSGRPPLEFVEVEGETQGQRFWREFQTRIKYARAEFGTVADDGGANDDRDELLEYPGLEPRNGAPQQREPRGPLLRQQLAALNATAGGLSSGVETGSGSGQTSRAARRWFLHPLASSRRHDVNFWSRARHAPLPPTNQDVPTVFHAASNQTLAQPIAFVPFERDMLRRAKAGIAADEDFSDDGAEGDGHLRDAPLAPLDDLGQLKDEFVEYARTKLGIEITQGDLELLMSRGRMGASQRSFDEGKKTREQKLEKKEEERDMVNGFSSAQAPHHSDSDEDSEDEEKTTGKAFTLPRVLQRLNELESYYTSYKAFAGGSAGPRRDYLMRMGRVEHFVMNRRATHQDRRSAMDHDEDEDGAVSEYEDNGDDNSDSDSEAGQRSPLNNHRQRHDLMTSYRRFSVDMGTHMEHRLASVAPADSWYYSNPPEQRIWGPIYYDHPQLPFRGGMVDAIYGAKFLRRHEPKDDGAEPTVDETLDQARAAAAAGAPAPSGTGSNAPDFLHTLLVYASELYEALGYTQAFMAMDETALLALGVVVEEAMRELVGPAGHRMYATRERSETEEHLKSWIAAQRLQQDSRAAAAEGADGMSKYMRGPKSMKEGSAEDESGDDGSSSCEDSN